MFIEFEAGPSFSVRIHGSRRLAVLAKVTKLPIAVLSALSAATGYVVFRHGFDAGMSTAFLGVLLLAMGACTLNEFQDRELDARMTRTRRRPLPSGAVGPAGALALALSLLSGGFLVLGLAHGAVVAGIGLSAVAWYNGLYTYLKRVWAFAAFPGALIGAAPPVLGWTAAGGDPLDPHVFALAFFFFIWQMPHFWLLLLEFGDDYAHARLPVLTQHLSMRQLAGLTFIWMTATSVSSLLLPLYRLTVSLWANLGLVILGLWLAWEAARLLQKRLAAGAYAHVFRTINIYVLLVMALLAADAML